MDVVIIDSSILLEIFEVPGFCSKTDDLIREMRRMIKEKCNFILPIAAIIETGNLIVQVSDGRLRRSCAERFVERTTEAINGIAPWVVTPLPERSELATILAQFPDSAMRSLSFGDHTIIDLWTNQRTRWPDRRVFIWSLDGGLSGYDSHPIT